MDDSWIDGALPPGDVDFLAPTVYVKRWVSVGPWWSEFGFRYRLAIAVEAAGILTSRVASRVANRIMPEGFW